jgi:hypothetical protein
MSGVAGEGKRRWLAYNVSGCISSREDDGFCVVEVSFHDTSRHRKRVPLLNDFYHFSMASLGAKVRPNCDTTFSATEHLLSFCKAFFAAMYTHAWHDGARALSLPARPMQMLHPW